MSGHHHYCQISAGDQSKNSYSFVCEGVETALSVHQAFPDSHLIASLGKNNYPRLEPGVLGERVVLVLDNDSVPLTRDKLLQTTVERLVRCGKLVYYVLPPHLDNRAKTDMNVILIHHGVDSVLQTIINNMKKVRM